MGNDAAALSDCLVIQPKVSRPASACSIVPLLVPLLSAKVEHRNTWSEAPSYPFVPLFHLYSSYIYARSPPRACPCTCVYKQKVRKKWNNGTSGMFHAADQGKPRSTSENQKRNRFARVHTFLASDQAKAAFRRVPFLESRSGTRRLGGRAAGRGLTLRAPPACRAPQAHQRLPPPRRRSPPPAPAPSHLLD